MAQQASLPGFDAARKPTDRLFFGIVPDVKVAGHIEDLAQQLRDKNGLKGKPHDAARFHITLHHIGDYAGLPQDVVSLARDAANAVAMPPLDIMLDRAMSFRDGKHKLPFVLRVGYDLAAFTEFWKALGAALEKAGFGRWLHPNFVPHLTLMYDHCQVAEQDIEPVRWTANEFVLIKSLLGHGRHVPLARWAAGPGGVGSER